jgi:hypothetical protein
MSMTLAELTSALENYCVNTEASFVAAIPSFVRQTETRIFNSVQLPVQRKVAVSAFVAGTNTYTLPSDFLSPLMFEVEDMASSFHGMLNKDVEWLREAYRLDSPSVYGQPKYYAILSSTQAMVAPTPDQNYITQLHYNAYPQSLVDVTAGAYTWLSQNYDPVLLYGCLVEAYTYMKGEPDLIELYDKKYKEALAQLKALSDGRLQRDQYRKGALRA